MSLHACVSKRGCGISHDCSRVVSIVQKGSALPCYCKSSSTSGRENSQYLFPSSVALRDEHMDTKWMMVVLKDESNLKQVKQVSVNKVSQDLGLL